MPRINRTRLVNIIYGDYLERCIPDLITDPQGEDCLHKLINNGGKSVISCFMLQPFAWQYDRYPRTSSEPLYNIKKYFIEKGHNNEPCYVLQELILEDGTFLLVGVGIQNLHENEPLSKIAFIYKYSDMDNPYSLSNFELHRFNDEGRKIILNVSELDNRFKKAKYTSELRGVYRRRAEDYTRFYEELQSYHITKEEIFNIYVKFNAKECNVATLFTKDKITTSTKLIDTWIIPYINEKINKDNTEFLDDIIKALANYTMHKKENEELLKKLTHFKEFLEDWRDLERYVSERVDLSHEHDTVKGQLSWLREKSVELSQSLESSITSIKADIEVLNESLLESQYNRDSLKIKNRMKSYTEEERTLIQTHEIVCGLEQTIADLELQHKLLSARKDYDEWQKYCTEIKALKARQNPEERALLEEQSRNIVYSLHCSITQETDALNKGLNETISMINEGELTISSLSKIIKDSQIQFNRLIEQSGILSATLDNYRSRIEDECMVCEIDSLSVLSGIDAIMEEVLNTSELSFKEELNDILLEIQNTQTQQNEVENRIDTIIKEVANLTITKCKAESNLELYQAKLLSYNEEYNNIRRAAQELSIEYTVIEQIQSVLNAKEENTRSLLEKQKEVLYEVEELLSFYNGNAENMNSLIEKELINHNIDYLKGSDFLIHYTGPVDKLFKRIPFLPYAIIVSRDSYDSLQDICLGEFTKTVLPVLIQEELEKYDFTHENSIFQVGNIALFGGYDPHFIDSDYINNKIEELLLLKSNTEDLIEQFSDSLQKIELLNRTIDYFTKAYNNETSETLQYKIGNYTSEITVLIEQIENCNIEIDRNKRIAVESNQRIEEFQKRKENLEDKQLHLAKIRELYDEYNDINQRYNSTIDTKKKVSTFIIQQEQDKMDAENLLNHNREKMNQLKILISNLMQSEYSYYLDGEYTGEICSDINGIPLSKEALINQLRALQDDERFKELKSLDQRISDLTRRSREAEENFNENHIDIEQIAEIIYERHKIRQLEKELSDKRKLKDLRKEEYDRAKGRLEIENNSICQLQQKCIKDFGRDYNIDVVSKDYNREIENINHDISMLTEECKKKSNNNERINVLLDDWVCDMEIIPVPLDITVSENNCISLKKDLSSKLFALDKSYEENLTSIKDFVAKAQRTYVVNYKNEDIKKMLLQIESAIKEDIITNEVTYKIREKLETYIIKNSDTADVLEKERSIIIKELLPKCEQILKELQNFDRYSIMNDERLIRLEKVPTQGYEDAIIEEIDIAIDSAIKKETLNDIIDEYNKRLTLPSLMKVYCNTPVIRVKVMKYSFTTHASHFLTPFENSHDNGGASGAQALICVFEVLLTLTRYLKASTPSKRDMNYGTFFFIDNPFGSITTSFFIDTLFSILNYFGAQLISFTDISETCILEVNKHIFDYKFDSKNNNDYLRASRIAGESLPQEYLRHYNFEEKQLSLFDM